ncbi:MAG: PhnD/SsuA/transferrin family substrate-binding protein [Chroococcidiopsidaceae cyanobacterium CP_BM_ER_R8_30]|nr:PhnD/SsuA/transferrin family substrate-binding protein [Chroococcidiopsidaceae cyanobacterium CP_BM_ER_R8_30]
MSSKSMQQPDKLRLVSYLAPNMFWFYTAVRDYFNRVWDIETDIVQSQLDPLSDPLLLQDQLDVAFMCGLPFIGHYQVIPNQLQALVAPVMQCLRYQNRPVYFSDIIVNVDSRLTTFDDLAGKTLCYNDPGSNSGYNLLLHQLIQTGHSRSFFGKMIQSGSHQRSINLVVEGLADCSAIDSTVLEQELRDSPELAHRLRVIESIGPCPIPPIVAAQHLGSEFIDCLQSALLQPDMELRSAMDKAQIRHYVAVHSEDYAAIATIYNTVVQAGNPSGNAFG